MSKSRVLSLLAASMGVGFPLSGASSIEGVLMRAPRGIARGYSAGTGRKAPNPPGTKLARKAAERKLTKRWC